MILAMVILLFHHCYLMPYLPLTLCHYFGFTRQHDSWKSRWTFSIFPTILLIATLLRLHPQRCFYSCGYLKVIMAVMLLVRSFKFSVKSSLAVTGVVGMVIFVILMIINFVVITGGESVFQKCQPALRWMPYPANKWR